MSIETDITHAIIGSQRFDRDGNGKRGNPVGYDIFAVTGHVTIGDTVYLTLQSHGWVRSKEALIERQIRDSSI